MRLMAAAVAALLGTWGLSRGAPAPPPPPSCTDCAHTCMWALQIESATKYRALFADIDVAFEANTVAELKQGIDWTMVAWSSGKDAEEPCLNDLMTDFTPAPNDTNVFAQTRQILDYARQGAAPAGTLLSTNMECKVEGADELKSKVCPELFDVLMAHESVHVEIWQSLRASAAAKGYSKARTDAFIKKTYSDPLFHQMSEVKAYDRQIALMREKMAETLKENCHIESKSIKDYLAKLKTKPNIPNLFEAIHLMNSHNRATKRGSK
jgi:hypothetical protein